jgi:hypothetical protein
MGILEAYPGETPGWTRALCRELMHSNNGAFQIAQVSFIRVARLHIINSQDAGFTVRDSSYIDLINNSTAGTYSSGIAVWDTNHDDGRTHHIRVLGNSVTGANKSSIAPTIQGEAPYEAISVSGAVNFEVPTIMYTTAKKRESTSRKLVVLER